MKFVNLHTHSHYSLLDGLPKIPELVQVAKNYKMPALALTDHGVMYGAVEFYKACQKAGIKPIIGVEAYLALEHRTRKQSKLDDDYYHLVLLAENNQGYKNLMKLTSLAHLEGFYYKPRIDKDSLREHSEGIIALSGCLGGEIPRQLLDDKGIHGAKQILDEYLSIFGENNVFLEVQSHPEIPEQGEVNDFLKTLSAKSGVPRVATLDCHYLHPEDAEAQDVLVCVSTGKLVSDAQRLDMRGVDLSLCSPEEVYKRFARDTAPVEQSLKIAERCNVEIEIGKLHFPTFEVPDNKSAADYLREQAYAGLQKRYNDREIKPEANERIEYELKIINEKGYSAYFLAVADFVNWMRERGIITTTRGSAAGCMVSYCLGITNVDPLEFGLPFERFLNPYRPSPPDIDVDIADNRRGEVLEYVTEKYGKDKVAQIITFGTMLARAAVRDVGRVLGIPYAKCDTIAKLVPPPRQGFPMPIKKALETSPELKQQYDTDAETKKIIDLVKKVEGSARHSSVHAAGVVISPTPLTDFTPIQHDVDGQFVVTQYDMHAVEDVGLVKMDFLGIRNLSILGNAIEIIKAKHGIKIDHDNLPLDDKKTYELLAKGETVGVFQLGGSGMTAYLKELKPTNIYDIAAMIALYRPGPMENIPEYIKRKHNPKLIKYPDPRLTEVLEKSLGILTYQDDVLFTALTIAGYDWGEVDKLRKAIGKKIPAEMAAQEEKFKKGIVENGGDPAKASELWDLIKPFAAYGFNKAHAASYAMVTYQTAYLKANYPAEFMAAVLTAESHDLDKVAAAVEECKKMGIEVLPPDINESFKMFAVVENPTTGSGSVIRWALTAVKNVGHDVVSEMIKERKANGVYSSFQNFVGRLQGKVLNRKGLESLIQCGAFDKLGERNTLLANLDTILEAARAAKRNIIEGQTSLFTGGQQTTAAPSAISHFALETAEPATTEQKLSWEKDLLGLYITAHPLEDHQAVLDKLTSIKDATQMHEGSRVAVGGLLNKVHKITTRKGEPMAFITFEDLSGTAIEAICFPRTYAQYMNTLEENPRVIVVGKISDKDGENKIIIDELLSLNEKNAEKVLKNGVAKPQPANTTALSKSLAVKIPKQANESIFADLKKTFMEYPGDVQIVLFVPEAGGQDRKIVTPYRISPNEDFKQKVKTVIQAHAG